MKYSKTSVASTINLRSKQTYLNLMSITFINILNISHIMDKKAIVNVSKACSESCKIMEECIRLIPNFSYEYQIKRYLGKEAKKKGYRLAFDTIVASAKNAAKPHYSKCTSKLKQGFLVIDFGVRVNGYCADMTRTVYLGNPSKKEKALYRKVLNVQLKSINILRKKPMSAAYIYARKILGKEFIHSLGHGVGKRIHQPPNINSKNNSLIENGTCFTVEPGVYRKKKYGIRIEDTLVKLNNKFKILTPLTKELIIINKKLYK
jgi:Xaa-Pro aminopeptidase